MHSTLHRTSRLIHRSTRATRRLTRQRTIKIATHSTVKSRNRCHSHRSNSRDIKLLVAHRRRICKLQGKPVRKATVKIICPRPTFEKPVPSLELTRSYEEDVATLGHRRMGRQNNNEARQGRREPSETWKCSCSTAESRERRPEAVRLRTGLPSMTEPRYQDYG